MAAAGTNCWLPIALLLLNAAAAAPIAGGSCPDSGHSALLLPLGEGAGDDPASGDPPETAAAAAVLAPLPMPTVLDCICCKGAIACIPFGLNPGMPPPTPAGCVAVPPPPAAAAAPAEAFTAVDTAVGGAPDWASSLIPEGVPHKQCVALVVGQAGACAINRSLPKHI